MNKKLELYRGRRSYDKQWIYGSLLVDCDGDFHILEPGIVEKDGHHIQIDSDSPMFFDQETIGKYINQEDKDGNFLFEGDICVIEGYEEEGYFLVCMDDYSRYLLGQFTEEHTPILTYTFANVEAKEIKLIGNIYDNPKFMGENEKAQERE